jgi:dihydroorotase-like cyclic amidohydrolase
VNKNRITLKKLVEVTARNPARRFGLHQKGIIAVDADADLVMVDMKKKYTIRNENMFTKPGITVFDGMEVQGAVEKTLVRGAVVYDNGEFCMEKGYGEFLTS